MHQLPSRVNSCQVRIFLLVDLSLVADIGGEGGEEVKAY